MAKPYYNAPDNLEHIHTLDDPSSCYDFHDIILIKDTNSGKYYVASDSGCSCPSPFEGHTFPTDFTEVKSGKDYVDFVSANKGSTRYSWSVVGQIANQLDEALDNA